LEFNFDKVLNRRASGAEKWKGIPDGAISMSIADMEFPMPAQVREAVKAAADFGESGYVGMSEKDYKAVIDWVFAQNGEVILPENLIATPGVLYAARTAMYALTRPGDKVIVQTPLHTPSIASASMLGRIPLENRLIYENGKYRIDFDQMENLFRQGARVLMLCTPHNPTGRVWTLEELEQIATLINKYDAYIISDEIHRDIVWPGKKHISPASIPALAQRSVSVFSTSKSFNMGGFHIGSAHIPNPDIRDKVVRRFYCHGHTCARPSIMSIAAQTAAYTKCGNWFNAMLDYVGKNFELALECLKDLPIHASMPDGTFLLWADISDMGISNDELWKLMRDEWKVICDPGSFYDSKDYMDFHGLEHHIRFNLATSHAQVEQAMDSILKSFK